ncbi:hypothetical protein MRS44_004515 [Fusarium solani]|uniref:BTB domain-containing protein n=1 Tax=Fusarium solani TaxID=169388 RepID=A0A9P9L0C9_FUSSL|nr:uncharacterized protein B0J15DRAFT_544615 [Fusarium solani]KAH7271737.1 hypothetical protein B0J15DRAFT_544615 [Fusarium solani]KAJ3466951.1 hypothetical protein MRS44_004515 [Fusarium solani]
MEAEGTGDNSSSRVQSMVIVTLAGPKHLFLPEKAISKYPKLASRFVGVQNDKRLDLTSWPTAVVHVLVIFLFTGTYQDLHDLDEDELEQYDEPEAVLNRVLQTYLLATEYGLDRLVQLAVHGFDVTSSSMSLPSVLHVVCGSNITFDNQHLELMNNLIQRASRIGREVELDEGLGTYRLALKNDGTVFGALFSQILEQRVRIRDLMLENERLNDQLDPEMG